MAITAAHVMKETRTPVVQDFARQLGIVTAGKTPAQIKDEILALIPTVLVMPERFARAEGPKAGLPSGAMTRVSDMEKALMLESEAMHAGGRMPDPDVIIRKFDEAERKAMQQPLFPPGTQVTRLPDYSTRPITGETVAISDMIGETVSIARAEHKANLSPFKLPKLQTRAAKGANMRRGADQKTLIALVMAELAKTAARPKRRSRSDKPTDLTDLNLEDGEGTPVTPDFEPESNIWDNTVNRVARKI